MSGTPLRDMLRAKGDPFADELDLIEQIITTEWEHDRQRLEMESRRRAAPALVGRAGP